MKTKSLKRILLSAILLIGGAFMGVSAQSIDGATYSLPKTGVTLTILVEKTVYTPGELAEFARRYLRDADVKLDGYTAHRVLSGTMGLYAAPDTSKIHTAHVDTKHNIQQIVLSDDGILQAINAEAVATTKPSHFTASYKPRQLDPKRYLNQDILSAGSKLKMAELVAKEIYTIRESRSELTRGEAEYMPKDGEQLRIMLASLDQQEAALRQLFEGTKTVDTTEVSYTYMPEKGTNESVLFRFSKLFGAVDADDLSGRPYIIKVEDLQTAPQPIIEVGKKAPKDETGVWINRPGKIRVTVLDPEQHPWKSMEFSAGQFGFVENLNEPLFMKKVTTRLTLNPYNGGIEKIDSAPNK